MDGDTKRLLGKVLGELFRLQRRVDPSMCGVSDETIYGLLNGFDQEVDEALEGIGHVSSDNVEAASQILDEIWSDPAKLATFNGFYDIEQKLREAGISRAMATKIFRYFKADDAFGSLLAKMDSSGSPAECRTFELGPWEK